MNPERFRTLQLNLSGFSNGLLLLTVFLLLTSMIGLGWLVNSILIIIGVIVFVPILAGLGLWWWVSRNLIVDQCPVCQHEFTALNQTQIQCPSCGEPLQIQQGHFTRLTPPGTIDVQVVDVSAQTLKD